jgi:maintenance of mitochondrial morphology protein 1
VPKIAQLVEARIHAWLKERCVEPRYQQIVLPSLWPRRKNTRGGEEEDEQTEDVEQTGDSDTGLSEHLELNADPFTANQAQPGGSDLSDRNTARRKVQTSNAWQQGDGAIDGVRYRTAHLRQQKSTEDLRIPGRFD